MCFMSGNTCLCYYGVGLSHFYKLWVLCEISYVQEITFWIQQYIVFDISRTILHTVLLHDNTISVIHYTSVVLYIINQQNI